MTSALLVLLWHYLKAAKDKMNLLHQDLSSGFQQVYPFRQSVHMNSFYNVDAREYIQV